MEIKIEKGIPNDKPMHGQKSSIVRDMDIGDSFAIINEEECKTFRTLFYRLNRKCSIQKQKDGTFRLWCTK